MREIKFRAWEKKDKVMHVNVLPVPPDDISYEYKGVSLLPLKDTYEFMQYTGLRDKHGKEIYEGDIIVPNGYKDLATQIKWFRGSFGTWAHDRFRPIHEEAVNSVEVRHWEIIGNIYENPELLK